MENVGIYVHVPFCRGRSAATVIFPHGRVLVRRRLGVILRRSALR